MLRDWLVCGVNHEQTQQQLLSEGPSLTLQKALDISLALESGVNQDSIIQGHQITHLQITSSKYLAKEMTLVFVVKETIYHQPAPSLIKNVFTVKSKGHVMKVCRTGLKADKKQKTTPSQHRSRREQQQWWWRSLRYILYTATSEPNHKSRIKYQQQANYYEGRYRCICMFN